MARVFSAPIIGQSAASGAQVIDGSLYFDNDKEQVLTRTPSSAGDRDNYTGSVWIKRTAFAPENNSNSNAENYTIFTAGTNSANNIDFIKYYKNAGTDDANKIEYASYIGSYQYHIMTNAKYRDPNGWHHVVWNYDGTTAKLYVNGEQITSFDTNTQNGGSSGHFNNTVQHVIGGNCDLANSSYFDGHMSQFYWIDGQTLDASYFGFTDPLTNNWKPKKYEGTFGTNGFYLPMDGNSPIGKDQSGQGNDYTPVNFGGSVSLDKATGARPILNTTQGGTQAGVGVFGSRENVGYAVTVFNSKYYIDGVETPTLSGLIRGATYTFDQSDSTNSGHPLVFGSTAEGNNFARGANYGSVSAGSAGAATTITVPHDAPDTLYYHCSVHSGYGSDITNITTNELKADQYASNCVFALPIIGDKEDVSASIACTMSNASITNSGVDFVTSQFNFYSGSGDFTGASSDALYTGDDDTKFKMEEEDFTVECWVYSTSSSGTQNVCQFYGTGGKYYGIYWNGSSLMFYVTGTGGPGDVSAGDIVFGKSRWYHLALVRNGSTLKGYVDGVEVASDSITSDIDETGYQAYVGRHSPANNGFTGYIQDFRVYKGVAKYTSDFVVASPSPNILPDTPSGVSGSSKLAKITDGAVSFEGTATSKLKLDDSTDFTFGTNDFAIEFFYYNEAFDGTYDIIFDCMGSNRSGIQLAIETDNDYRIEVGDGANNWIWQSTGFDSKARKWTHFALTREGSTFRAFEDGVLLGTQTSSTAVGDPRSPAIGGYASDDSTNYGFNGFISNFRIVNGSAVYTAAFTPPTAPLTNVTNTKLLTCQTPTAYQIAAVAPLVSGVNNGTVWSSSVAPGSAFRSTFPAVDAFNGDTKTSTNDCAAVDIVKNAFFEFTFGEGVPFTTLQMQCDDNNEGTVVANGVDITSQLPTGSLTNTTITGVSSPLTSLRLTKTTTGSSSVYLGSVTIDGTMLVDPVAPIDAKSTNFNQFNTDINIVRGQETGYPTFSPLRLSNNAPTLSENNLTVTAGGSAAWYNSGTTIDVSSGKWFWEVYPRTVGGSGFTIGVALEGYEWNRDTSGTGLPWLGSATGTSWSVYSTGQKYFGASGTNYMDAFTTSDVIGVALDVDANTLTYYQNGISKGVAFSDVNPAKGKSLQIGLSVHGTGSNKASINFGQKPFRYPPPEGFQPLNTANVRPETVILRPDQYVGIVTYMGAGGTKNVDGLKFSPDMVWVKALDSAFCPMLGDSVRGFSETTMLSPANNAEEDRSTDPTDGSERGYISAKNIRGFNVTDGTGTSQVNGSGEDYVAWCWKAGGDSGNFNIDYVGYSTAGDAAMSIGDQNNVGYNTEQNWGSGATGEINPGGGALESGCFNGDFSDSINSYWGDTSKAITYTFNNLPFKKLRFYGVGSNISNSYVRFNGVDQTQAKIKLTNLKFGWFEAIGVPSPLNKIEVYTAGSSDFLSLYAVEVDGKILVNSNVTPPNLPSIPATGASVGTEQGFSIVTYTGTGSAGTIPHRLTQDPDFVIFKQRNNQDDWRVFHKDLDPDEAQDYYLILQSTNGKSADQNQSFMNRVPPTGPVIHLGTDSAINGSSTTMVAYSWHSVPGLQKFGTFAGNSDADGTFVELGFRPALLWVKRTDTTGNWVILNTKRSPFNPILKSLYADSCDAEYTPGQQWADILSNGFKIRATYGEVNVGTYIYCAWAEAPSVDLFGGGANAR